MKPAVLQLTKYPEWDQEVLDANYVVHRGFEIDDMAAFFQTHGASIRGVTGSAGELIDRKLIESLPNLEVISVYGVGFDKVDLEAAREHGVRVSNTPDVLTDDVADLALGMLLMASRRMGQAEAWVRSGDWLNKGSFPLSQRVYGRRAGILGLGRIGEAIGQRLAGFDMTISYSSRSPKDTVPADWTYVADALELAKQCDILFVGLAANDKTRHMVNKEVIEALGHNGMLINISRAANIDEEALLDALEAGTLGAAALDVFEGEPDLNPRFLALDNVLLQPHHASGTVDTRKAMGKLMLDNLQAYFDRGELLTPVV
jgi:lactate dehydrogenase-like 2-hydroxyacid dehydrogenase